MPKDGVKREHLRCSNCGWPNHVEVHEYYISSDFAEELFRRINMALSPEIATLTKDINDALTRISKTQADTNGLIADLKAQITALKGATGLSPEDKAAIQALDTTAKGIDVPEPPVEPPVEPPATPPVLPDGVLP
jgi:hypothetical protein